MARIRGLSKTTSTRRRDHVCAACGFPIPAADRMHVQGLMLHAACALYSRPRTPSTVAGVNGNTAA